MLLEFENSNSKNFSLQLDLESTEWGPFHPALPGWMKIQYLLDGDRISQAGTEIGFSHKGLERVIEGLDWDQHLPLVSRVDPETSVFSEWAYALALESVSGTVAPPRANWIRVLLAEMARASSHLRNLSDVSQSVGAESAMHYLLRDREKILDLFEHLTGSRFNQGMVCPGGVRQDITDGFIERLVDVCGILKQRIEEYKDVLVENQSFLRRAVGVGWVSIEDVEKVGLSGPNARACGKMLDARKDHVSAGVLQIYQEIGFSVHVQSEQLGCDSHDRIAYRLEELERSVFLMEETALRIPDGVFREPVRIPDHGERFSTVESSRGELSCYVKIKEGKSQRVHFEPPSFKVVQVLPKILRGACLEDVGLILSSLDICIQETDR